jgi:hypothetical protein
METLVRLPKRPKRLGPRPCKTKITDPHHSPDRIAVYEGSTTPRIVCGYHAMREGLTP